jgi:hypothetical protein
MLVQSPARHPATNTPSGRTSQIPLVIASDEEFYWSRKWQDEQNETYAELAAGEGRRFPNAAAAIQALFEVDEA